jgi:large subunit ribosomal protein L15
MPLQRRVPKFGFTNINRKEYEGVNLDTLQLWLTMECNWYCRYDNVANRLATKMKSLRF